MNKMFKKIVATTAAVSTVACLSVSAFAATADYDKDTQKVKLTDWAASGDGQYTIVVVPKTWDGSDEDIYYINQDSEKGMATLVNGMGVKTDLYALADAEADDTAEFQVWVGSDVAGYTIAKFDFTVSAKAEGMVIEFLLGDVNDADGVTGADANYILSKLAGGSASVGGPYDIGEIITDVNGIQYAFGDVNGADGVTGADANYILSKLAGGSAAVGGTVGIGEMLTLTIPAE